METQDPDFQDAYTFAIAKGESESGAKYFANEYCSYQIDELKPHYDEDIDDFIKCYRTHSFHEIALGKEQQRIKIVDLVKSWGHSEEWCFYYANHEDYGKGEAYAHIRIFAPETLYKEAFDEYIARGFSENFAIKIATEIQQEELTCDVEELENSFLQYEEHFKEAINKSKSVDFADFYATYRYENDTIESYSWAMALLREQLKIENKSIDFINDVLWILSINYDDISEDTLKIENDDYYKIIGAYGYADGKEFAIKNNISEPQEFGKLMIGSYNNCNGYDYIYPYKELALLWTINKYNQTASIKIPISQLELDLVTKVDNEIYKDIRRNYYEGK